MTNSHDISKSAFLSIKSKAKTLEIDEFANNKITYSDEILKQRNISRGILSWIEHRSNEKHLKYIACKLVAEEWLRPIISDLWLTEDIVPYFKVKNGNTNSFAFKKQFSEDDTAIADVDKNNEVQTTELVSLNDYHLVTHDLEMEKLKKLAKKCRGKKIVFINATAQGGGVAIMRHALIRLFKLLNVDAHWYVLKPSEELFLITKQKFHNVLQGVSDSTINLTDTEKQLYNKWIEQNAKLLRPAYRNADVVVIDDPQPSGLISFIKATNPKCKIIYRSHIQLEAKLADKIGIPQYNTWQFLWQNISKADLFISHPIPAFVPKNVVKSKLVYMPPTTDPLDGLNKPLRPTQMEYYLNLFNKYLRETGQKGLDPRRAFIVQIARFDPSKGIPDLIQSYSLLVKKLKNKKMDIPQLVIAGHGSVDDPDGVPIYNVTMEMLASDQYKHLKDDVKIARIPPIDQVLNAVLRDSKVCLQLSHKEGFEFKVTEALMKGIPMVAYKAGGIPLQIQEGINGFLVDTGDTKAVASKLYKLFTDDELYVKMSKAAPKTLNPEVNTVSNAINWLFLTSEITKHSINGNGKNVKELMK